MSLYRIENLFEILHSVQYDKATSRKKSVQSINLFNLCSFVTRSATKSLYYCVLRFFTPFRVTNQRQEKKLYNL